MKTPMHMSMGQEAVAVGVCEALGPQGQVFGFYRSHAVFLAKTDDPDRFFGELYGRVSGTAHGKAGSMHLAAPDKGFMCASAIVASSIPVAIGAAFANKQKRNDVIACAYFGDGALEEGVFWESLNVACVMKLPALFVCEDNGLAVHTATHARQGYKSITNIVSNFECSVLQENTTDVETIYNLALEAAESIRSTQRPAFLHLKCYRYLEHVGIGRDFDAGYRAEAEFDEWNRRDPLLIQRQKLLSAGFSEEDLRDAERRLDDHLQQSVQKAKSASLPDADELYTGIFG
jgi:pyruvate dehydrogenase E1 component alpha subunit